MSAAKNEVI